MTRKLALAAAGAASLLLAACGETESGTITLALERNDCKGVSALVGARQIEVTVRGPEMTEVTASGAFDAGRLDLPEIPAGKDREVIVRAINAASVVVAIGRSAPIDVKADQDQSVTIPMVALNRFHPPQSVASGACSTQQGIRAGHAAATFSDGRALLVGGFVYDQEENRLEYLDTVELYDPATGEFRLLPPLPSICGASGEESCERAFGAAIVQPLARGERFLVIGGEYRDQEGVIHARGEALSFDPASETWSTTAIKLSTPRRHHTASLLPVGVNYDVYIVGGFGEPTPESTTVPVVSQVEVIKPSTIGETTPGVETLKVPRALHAAVVYNSDLLIVGGVDEDYGLPTSVLTFGATSKSASVRLAGSSPIALREGVVGSSLAVLGKHLLVIGGIVPDQRSITEVHDILRGIPNSVGPEGSLSSGEVIALDGPIDSPVPLPIETSRAFACVAPIDADRVFVAGGITAVGNVVTGESSAEMLVWVDESQCVRDTCTVDYECTNSSCVDGQCIRSCTTSDECGAKGACVAGECRSDAANPDHRCKANATGINTCFSGSTCIESGHADHSYAGGFNSSSSKLGRARAWGACTRLSSDQILITGGLSESPRETLDVAEIYEISHAGR